MANKIPEPRWSRVSIEDIQKNLDNALKRKRKSCAWKCLCKGCKYKASNLEAYKDHLKQHIISGTLVLPEPPSQDIGDAAKNQGSEVPELPPIVEPASSMYKDLNDALQHVYLRSVNMERTGLLDVQKKLKEIASRRTAVRKGQGYMQHVRHYQRKEAKEGHAPVDPFRMVIQKPPVDPNRLYTLVFDTQSLDDRAQDEIKYKLQRKEQLVTEYLNTINFLLISIANLKSKQLLKRSPLIPEVVLALRKCPRAEIMIPPPFHKSYSVEPPITSLDGHVHMVAGPAQPYKRKGGRLGRRNLGGADSGMKRITLLRSLIPKKPTWDDIFIDDKIRRNKCPWHVAIEEVNNVYPNYAHIELIDNHAKRPSDVTRLPQILREKFMTVQGSVGKRTKDKLKKKSMLSEKKAMYHLTYGTLNDLSVLWPAKCRELSQLSKALPAYPIRDSGEEIEPWFTKLVDKVKEIENPQKDLLDKLDSIRFFATEKCPQMFNYKEKLCLLTISLPINEICEPAVRSGILFVLVDIFSLPDVLLSQWLAYRHICISNQQLLASFIPKEYSDSGQE